MDWNSFFSTVSQASASMIGVLLAFLASRIISESSDYDRLEYDGQAIIDESADLKTRIQSMDFDWHDTRIYEEHDFDEVRTTLISLDNTSDEVKIDFLKQELPRIYYPEKFIRRLNININAVFVAGLMLKVIHRPAARRACEATESLLNRRMDDTKHNKTIDMIGEIDSDTLVLSLRADHPQDLAPGS